MTTEPTTPTPTLPTSPEPVQPVLKPIAAGWAAHGTGWAVHGRTQEEALKKYWDGVAWRAEIDKREDNPNV